MATALKRSQTANFKGLAIKAQQLMDNTGAAVDMTTLTGMAGTVNTIKSTSGNHLLLNSGTTATDQAGKTVRINSITGTGTANSFIGFQSKPAQGASNANGVTGGEISPRINDTFTGGTIIGLHVDAYLKGTTGNLSGDVRALNLELVTDDAGARNVAGNVNAIRIRAAFSAGTVSGLISVIRVETMETQTGSEQWGYLFDLTGTSGGWGSSGTPGTQAGFLKLRVNGSDKWVQLFSSAS